MVLIALVPDRCFPFTVGEIIVSIEMCDPPPKIDR